MIGSAACRGAVTIVNAIATGRGCAFGIDLEVDAEVRLNEGRTGVELDGPQEGLGLARGCIEAVARAASGRTVGGTVRVRSGIPMSRGLKSSSASSNAMVLAAARALGTELDDETLLHIAIDQSIAAGVTITGALDDSAACFYGGVAITDNRARRILQRGQMDDTLRVVVHVPTRSIPKRDVAVRGFEDMKDEFERALALATKGEYLQAMGVNSRACAKVLGLSEDAVGAALASGAIAAGITGTGPATAALCRPDDEARVAKALAALEGDVLTAGINGTCAREVVPRLL
jgi:shikimate kinase